MARRIVNRKEKREEYDAVERRKEDVEEVDEEEGEEEEGDEEEDAEAEESPGDEDEDGEEEEAPRKKKKKEPKPKVKAKAKPKSRSRAAKIVRLKVVWGVFNNSNQRVATYEFPQRKQAEEHAAKLMADKRTTHFVQPIKEPFEVKKEE